ERAVHCAKVCGEWESGTPWQTAAAAWGFDKSHRAADRHCPGSAGCAVHRGTDAAVYVWHPDKCALRRWPAHRTWSYRRYAQLPPFGCGPDCDRFIQAADPPHMDRYRKKSFAKGLSPFHRDETGPATSSVALITRPSAPRAVMQVSSNRNRLATLCA